jgi:hypothetical protein
LVKFVVALSSLGTTLGDARILFGAEESAW